MPWGRLQDVQIGPADSAALDLDQHTMGLSDGRNRALLKFEHSFAGEDGGEHGRCGIGHWRMRSEAKTADEFTVAAGTGSGCAERRQHVLFDDGPAAVGNAGERVEDAGKIDRAHTEFTEHAIADGVVVIPSQFTRTCGDSVGTDLKMTVPD